MSCTTILVGKNASYNGSTMISRTEDGGIDPKKAIVVEPHQQPRTYKTVLSHLTVELPDNPMRYTSTPNVLHDEGTWAANGINSANVGMTATETINANPRVFAADPLVVYKKAEKRGQKDIPGGIGEEDMVLMVLPYIKSAREGAERLGALLEQYGTYESNGIAFHDAEEIWWLETIGGHHWMAKRVPDDAVVIMPNQRGIDSFDFEDAFGEKKEHLCSSDLREFMEKHHLNLAKDGSTNPRVIFGTNKDHDHVYNTPRAWFIGRYLAPRQYKWEGENADYTPESDNIPWAIVPELKITEEDLVYLLSSHYQGTDFDPYSKNSARPGCYRSIACNRTNVTAICQIRGEKPEKIAGVQWIGFGPTVFTAFVPVYTNVPRLPKYLTFTEKECSTDSFYWASRLIAALADPIYADTVQNAERYRQKTMALAIGILEEYDEKFAATRDEKLLQEANEKICAMLKEKTTELLGTVLLESTKHIKAAYHLADN